MADIEKVIDGLEMLRFFNQRAGRELWTDKPHDIQEKDIANADAILADAFELLKEQQGKIEKLQGFINGFSHDAIVPVRCKDCIHKEKHPSPYWKYWCNRLKCGCNDDWFCADGERS